MSSNFLSDTNWLLISALILGSAALSVLGDSLGSKYGKKRISLFGLRPKHTSKLITALTGAFIAIGILGVMSILSQDVRTALFGMKVLKQQMYSLQFQLNQSEENAAQMRTNLSEAAASLDLTSFELSSMKNDKLILEQEKKELEASLRVMREESRQLKENLKSLKSDAIALGANVLLGQTAFEPGMTREEITEGLNLLRQEVRLSALEKISDQAFTRLRDVSVEFNPEFTAELINKIVSSDSRQYVRAFSGENYTAGENLNITANLESGLSVLTYREGEPVYRKFFNNDSQRQPEENLHIFLRELRNKVIGDGILPDPATNNVGTLGGEEFFSAVDQLGKIKDPVIITALATENIYTEGPVKIEIIFEE